MEEPVPVNVCLGGAETFLLKVTGQQMGRANWAEAVVEMESGEQVWLDDLPMSGISSVASGLPPFSFVYGGDAQPISSRPGDARIEKRASTDRRRFTRAPILTRTPVLRRSWRRHCAVTIRRWSGY